MGLLALPVDGIEGLHSSPVLIALLILAHGIAAATVQQDRVDRISQPLFVLIGVGWIVSDYLIDGISRWDVLWYSIGLSLGAGVWMWEGRGRPDVAAEQRETP